MLENIAEKTSRYITIAYLSYNRGRALLKNLNQGLDKIPPQVQIMILNNASTMEVDEYNEIERLSLTCNFIEYILQEKNKLFKGNFIDAFKKCKTKYLMLMSDEDIINYNFFDECNINNYLINHNYAVLRPSVYRDPNVPSDIILNDTQYEDKEYSKGYDSLKNFSFIGTYISGYIYNLEIINKNNIIERLEANINKQEIYPHIYLNLLMGAKGATRLVKLGSCYAGAPVLYEEQGIIVGGSSDYKPPYSHGSRFDQLIAMRDAIFEAVAMIPNENPETFFDIYISAVEKYFYLICYVDGIAWHNKEKINVFRIANSFAEFALASIEMYPMREELRSLLQTKIVGIANAYVKLLYDTAKN